MTAAIRLPRGEPALRRRLALALTEHALDQIFDDERARFESDLIDARVPDDALDDALDIWQTTTAALRAELVPRVGAWIDHIDPERDDDAIDRADGGGACSS